MLPVTGWCMFCPPYKVGPKSPVMTGVTHFNFRPFIGIIPKRPCYPTRLGEFHLLAPKNQRRFRPQHWGLLGEGKKWIQLPIRGPNLHKVFHVVQSYSPNVAKRPLHPEIFEANEKPRLKFAKVSTPHVRNSAPFLL